MFYSKYIDIKQHSVCFPEIEKYVPIFFDFEFIRFSNRGVLSAAPFITADVICYTNLSKTSGYFMFLQV